MPKISVMPATKRIIDKKGSFKKPLIHLYRRDDKKFDLRIISKIKVWYTEQGYERKAGCYGAIRLLMKATGATSINFVDETVATTKGNAMIFCIELTGKPMPCVVKK